MALFSSIHGLNRWLLPGFMLVGVVVLAYEPARWLVNSWFRPGYDSPGALVFLAVASVFGWSASSQLRPCTLGRQSHRLPLLLLAVSFFVRLASQILAINVLGALMLVLDVYALGLLVRLSERRRAASPLGLAMLFFFALPLEPLLQRSLGFLLQQVSAEAACVVLSSVAENVSCVGVRITIDTLDVLVDLPCSGARLLILLFLGFFALTSVLVLPNHCLLVGGVLTLVAAGVLNALRIVVLALGLYHKDSLGIDVMQDPWHSGLGLVCAAVGLIVVAWWVRGRSRLHLASASPAPSETHIELTATMKTVARSVQPVRGSVMGVLGGGLFVLAALSVVALKPSPVDVSKPLAAPKLPISLAGIGRTELPVTRQEQRYFTSYGGSAARAGYGPHSLLLVQTTSPLRHLHTPDVCFSGAGHAIRYVGVDFSAGGEAIYHSRSPEGEELRVGVVFHNSRGRSAHSISEVVWLWLSEPDATWMMIQTVSPWQEPPGSGGAEGLTQAQFASGVRRYFNLAS